MVWISSRKNKFFVKSLYSVLEPGVLIPSATAIIWNPGVPFKACFFTWEAKLRNTVDLRQTSKERVVVG